MTSIVEPDGTDNRPLGSHLALDTEPEPQQFGIHPRHGRAERSVPHAMRVLAR